MEVRDELSGYRFNRRLLADCYHELAANDREQLDDQSVEIIKTICSGEQDRGKFLAGLSLIRDVIHRKGKLSQKKLAARIQRRIGDEVSGGSWLSQAFATGEIRGLRYFALINCPELQPIPSPSDELIEIFRRCSIIQRIGINAFGEVEAKLPQGKNIAILSHLHRIDEVDTAMALSKLPDKFTHWKEDVAFCESVMLKYGRAYRQMA